MTTVQGGHFGKRSLRACACESQQDFFRERHEHMNVLDNV
jgi:hypothetical protein